MKGEKQIIRAALVKPQVGRALYREERIKVRPRQTFWVRWFAVGDMMICAISTLIEGASEPLCFYGSVARKPGDDNCLDQAMRASAHQAIWGSTWHHECVNKYMWGDAPALWRAVRRVCYEAKNTDGGGFA